MTTDDFRSLYLTDMILESKASCPAATLAEDVAWPVKRGFLRKKPGICV